MDQDTTPPLEDIVSMRLDKVSQSNAEAGRVSLEPLERAEVDDLVTREIELLGNVAENEESEGDIKKGALFELVKDDLKVIADEGTTEKHRNSKIVALEIEKNLTFSDEINYSGSDNDSKTEREKIRNAIKAVDGGEVIGWGSVEEAKRFLEEDLNVSFEEVVVDEKELHKKEIEKIISTNEMFFVNFFFNDFVDDSFDEAADELGNKRLHLCRELLVVSGNEADWKTYQEDINTTDSYLFGMARSVYLEHLFGKKQLQEMIGESDTIKKYETKLSSGEITQNIEEHNRKLSALRGRNLAQLSRDIGKISIDRKWTVDAPVDVSRYMAEKLHFVETKKELEGDFGAVYKYLSKDILVEKYIEERVDMVKLNKEPRREVVLSVLQLHELAVNMDRSLADKIDTKYVTGFEKSLKSIVNMRNKKGEAIIPSALEVMMQVLDKEADDNKWDPINIDSDSVLLAVKEKLKGPPLDIQDEDEIKVVTKIARDLCRVLGVDAQYRYAKEPTLELGKRKRKKFESDVSGAALGSVLNYRTELNEGDIPPTLHRSIDLGFVPFLNKLSGSAATKSEFIGSADIIRLIDGIQSGNKTYQNWIEDLKGASAAKVAETKLINSKEPSITSFSSLFGGEYWYKGAGGRAAYLKNRLSSLTSYLIEKSRKGDIAHVAISKQFEKIMETNLFNSEEEVNAYLKQFGLPPIGDVGIIQPVLTAADETLNKVTGGYGPEAQKKELKRQGSVLWGAVTGVVDLFVKNFK